jgi:hypothetical protein
LRRLRSIETLAIGPTLAAPGVRHGVLWALGLAALGAVAVYHRAFGFFFALDDYTYLFRAAGIDPDPFSMRRLLGVRMYYNAGYQLLGLHPFGWHVVAFVVHVLNAGWVFVLARRLNVERDVAIAAALLFAMSPVAFTVVYWIAGIQELLSTFFILAATYVALREGRRRWFCVPLYVCAVLSKESVLCAPLALLFIGGRRTWRLVVTQLAVGAALFVSAGLHKRMLVGDLAQPYAAHYDVTLLENLATLMAWFAMPWRAYPDRIARAEPAHLWLMLIGVLGTYALLRMLRGRGTRALVAALAWFVALSLPVLPLKQHLYAYYAYAPQIGFLIGLAALVWRGAARIGGRWPQLVRALPAASMVVLCLLCAVFAWRNAREHEGLMLGDSALHHDAVLRYGTVAGSMVAALRDLDLTPEQHRVAIIVMTRREGVLAPGVVPTPGARRIRKIPMKEALREGRLLRLHFPGLEGGFVDSLTARDEQDDTVILVAQGDRNLQRIDVQMALVAQGLQQLHNDEYAAAERSAARALELDPQNLAAILVMIGARAGTGRVTEAQGILAQVEALNIQDESVLMLVREIKEIVTTFAGAP